MPLAENKRRESKPLLLLPDSRFSLCLAAASCVKQGAGDNDTDRRNKLNIIATAWRGNTVGVRSTAHLRSVPMRAEQPLLVRAHDEFCDVLEAVPTALLMFNQAGLIVLVNAELARLFGYARDDLLGEKVEMLVPERFRAVPPEWRRQYLSAPEACRVGAGLALLGLRKDGSEFPIDVGLNPVTTDEGRFVLCSIVDITEARRKATELEGQLRAVSKTHALIEFTLDGRVVTADENYLKMMGYTLDEIKGQHHSMFVEPAYRASLEYRLFWEKLARGEFIAAQYKRIGKDGREVWMQASYNPVLDINGKPLSILKYAADITMSKTSEENLRLANEMRLVNKSLEEFVYIVSHDFRSPLRGIADLMQWIDEDLGGDKNPKVAHNLERVSLRIRRLEQLIDDLLAYARAGAVNADVVTFDPRHLIERILELQPPPPGFEVRVDIPDMRITTARTPLETVLRNLLSNAVKHHDRDDGLICVGARAGEGVTEFSVMDDGPGIPARAQQHIFKLFQSSSAPGEKSSGLGLAVSKRLVEGHGGRIGVASRDGQRGTTFNFSWPHTQQSKPDEQA